MNWWSEFEIGKTGETGLPGGLSDRIECDVPLGRLTWFRVGGSARFVFHPRDAEDLSALVRRARLEEVPVKVLGSGANVLVSDDGFDGVVVRLDDPAFSRVTRCEGGLVVGAGVELMLLSRQCSEQGLAGLEGLAGIPATVGGAVCMNAGGQFGDFGTVVSEVEILRDDGLIERRTRDALGFGYRRSDVGEGIVLSARLALTEDDPDRVKKKFDECFEYKKASQPLADRSAGCVFKNPPGESAGALIDKVGLKGRAYRRASVSDRHANFIVTERGAKASDVLGLIDIVRERVADLCGILLELEIDVWGPTDGCEKGFSHQRRFSHQRSYSVAP